MSENFVPTHVITLDTGDRIEVQLVDGAAYTRAEWDANDQADYERQDNGEWTFQGQPFAGTVEALPRTPPKTRKFAFLLGNPLVKAAVYDAFSNEEAWEQAREEWGSNTFFNDARMEEIL